MADKKATQTAQRVNCPICGKFTEEAKIKAFDGDLYNLRQQHYALQYSHARLLAETGKVVNERDSLQVKLDTANANLEKAHGENTRLQSAISNHDAETGRLQRTIYDQSTMIQRLTAERDNAQTLLALREEEVSKLYARSWWQRLLNIIPE